MTESKALKALRKGSETALCWFIDNYTPYVTTIIHNILGSSMDMADIEEVTADVFFCFWENANKICSPKGYLGTIAHNKAKNKLRQLGKTLPLEEDLLVLERMTPEQVLTQKELAATVKEAVFSMEHPDRDIFLRFYYYCQTLEEISKEMEIPLSTVKTRLRRGRHKLKDKLTQYIT